MKAILHKDLRTLAPEWLLLVLFELASILSLALQAPQLSPPLLMSLAFAISLVGGFLFSFRSVATEDAGQGMAFLLSLPITPAQVVSAKFAVNLLLVSANFAVVWGGTWVYCHLQYGLPSPSLSLVLLLWLVQSLNNGLYLAAALVFSSARAIWLPFPLLFVAINLAVNWKTLAGWMPDAVRLAPAWTWAALLAAAVVTLYAATRYLYARAPVRREWA